MLQSHQLNPGFKNQSHNEIIRLEFLSSSEFRYMGSGSWHLKYSLMACFSLKHLEIHQSVLLLKHFLLYIATGFNLIVLAWTDFYDTIYKHLGKMKWEHKDGRHTYLWFLFSHILKFAIEVMAELNQNQLGMNYFIITALTNLELHTVANCPVCITNWKHILC